MNSGRPLSATLMYMTTVGVAELRQNLSRYLDRVKDGESLIVTEHGREVARLVPLQSHAYAEVATRNVRDFQDLGIPLFNPFEPGDSP